MELEKGEHFANAFTILEKIGDGGTATVYKAVSSASDCIVALKIYGSGNHDPDVISDIWNREHGALRNLDHPNIIKCIDAGRDDETNSRYTALEWIKGDSLEAYLDKNSPIEWESFYESLGSKILDALVYIAERNITHRDVSTGNIMIPPTGQPVLIDFGQAKLDSVSIGRTVAGWKTIPYSPPEDDAGSYTLTRDPYSFAAIIVRALSGKPLESYDDLYRQFRQLEIDQQVRTALDSALKENPDQRVRSIVEFRSLLEPHVEISNAADEIRDELPIRIASPAAENVSTSVDDDGHEITLIDELLSELNDTCSVYPLKGDGGGEARIGMETRSFRLVADIDNHRNYILVFVGLTRRLFNLDQLYKRDHWIAPYRFTEKVPTLSEDKERARRTIQSLYEGFEEFLQDLAGGSSSPGSDALASWRRLLDAMRDLKRRRLPPLQYKSPEVHGRELRVELSNPEDAELGESRVISQGNRSLFTGVIDRLDGVECVLISNLPVRGVEYLPYQGELEADWWQEKVSLDRQSRALERFRKGDLPEPLLGDLLTRKKSEDPAAGYGRVEEFFDKSLDAGKKEVVSRCLGGTSLLVTHGPPGTGKTKVIVELIRQTLKAEPTAKILLVSQTHVALDNALERWLEAEPDAPCVRIGSGGHEIDQRVQSCTIENRGRALREEIDGNTRRYIKAEAAKNGISEEEVELGVRISDLRTAINALKGAEERLEQLKEEIQGLEEGRNSGASGTSPTETASEVGLRAEVLERQIDGEGANKRQLEQEVASARKSLEDLGGDGPEFAHGTDDDLEQWSALLVDTDEKKDLANLIRMAEEWKLRFGQSRDFNAAIVSSMSVVAGTCVGFCRERSASLAQFDLCIVDEASKATTTELLVPLSQAKRAVILGDHHQLPAVVDHGLTDPRVLSRFGIDEETVKVQLFEELARGLPESNQTELLTQYRMRGAIGELVSRSFYDGRLEAAQETAEREAPDLSLAGLKGEVTWIDPHAELGNQEAERRQGTSYRNPDEVKCICDLLRRLAFVFQNLPKDVKRPTIGVISGYRTQVHDLDQEISRDADLRKLGVECATVHSFQGREVDIAIYSVTRHNRKGDIGMLADWRHLNVALSRARDFLVLVGGQEFCRSITGENPFKGVLQEVGRLTGAEIQETTDA